MFVVVVLTKWGRVKERFRVETYGEAKVLQTKLREEEERKPKRKRLNIVIENAEDQSISS